MNFIVIWTNAAIQELARVWLASDDRNGVTAAADAIERLLADDPGAVGDELFDTVRVVAYGALGAEFEVDAASRCVFVLSVWGTTTGRPAVTGN